MYSEYIEILRSRLDDYRFDHSLAVARQAAFIAEKCGYDSDKAFLAGLLHDITKNDSNEFHLQLFHKFGIILNGVENNSPKLWHAISGALYVEHILCIKDIDIINAIRYHTTGKANMSLLNKIIYIADFTSSDRKYPDVDYVRQLLNENMDKAILYALRHTVKSLSEKYLPVHSDTLDAYNFLIVQGGISSGD